MDKIVANRHLPEEQKMSEHLSEEVYVNEYFSWVPQLPQIPDELLILDFDELINTPWGMTPKSFSGLTPTYTSHAFGFGFDVPPEITELLQPYFPWKIRVRYQIMTKHVHSHMDYSRKCTFNYLLQTGGDDVYTSWKKDDAVTEIYKVCAPLRTWHRLQTDIYHAVSPHPQPRIAISVWPASHNNVWNFDVTDIHFKDDLDNPDFKHPDWGY